MKIDLIYPKIPENSDKFQGKCIAFEKYDGTNLHWIWNIDDGWHKFGTRRTQFSFDKGGESEFIEEHSELERAPELFNDTLRDWLTTFLCQTEPYKSSKVTVFTEFYGPNSFAGNHSPSDADKDWQQLTLIDVAIGNQIIAPDLFVNDFRQFPIAKIIYKGKYSGQFAQDVIDGKYNVNEGVVCKGLVDNRVFMTKIKTEDYLKRLRQR